MATTKTAPQRKRPAKPALRPTATPTPAAQQAATVVPQRVPAPAPVASRPAAAPAVKAKAKDVSKGKGRDLRKKDKDKKSGSKPDHPKKKPIRDSFTMPADEYALIPKLKARALAVGIAVKKSELLRAGLGALAQMPSSQLAALIGSLPKIKTGRPGKKKK